VKQSPGTSENDVKKGVARVLACYPQVIHWDRLNSGAVRVDGRFIRLCKPGTPDLFALVRGHDDETHLLFIETKRPGKTKLDPDQETFRDKVITLKNVHHITANCRSDVSKILTKLIYGPK
jgi:hypothetical protein